MYPHIVTHSDKTNEQTLTVVMDDGNIRAVTSRNAYFNLALAAIKDNDKDALVGVFTQMDLVAEYAKQLEGVSVEGRRLVYNGEELPQVLSDRIKKMQSQGFSVEPLKAFWANLRANPTPSTVNELYQFLEQGVLPITDDGCFLAYKYVRDDYKDCYSGKFDNSVGAIVSMKRSDVDTDRNRTCSHGLHFGALSYMPKNGSGRRIMIVKVNPADVVAIPTDYSFTKGRTWKYEVVAEYTGISTGNEVTQRAVVHDVGDLALDTGEDEGDYYEDGDVWNWWEEEAGEVVDRAVDNIVGTLRGKYLDYYDAVLLNGPASPSYLGNIVEEDKYGDSVDRNRLYARDACYYLGKLVGLGVVKKDDNGLYDVV